MGMKKITVNIKEHLEAKGWTVRRLSYRAETSRQTIHHYLGNPQGVKLDVLARICAALEVTPGDILTLVDDES